MQISTEADILAVLDANNIQYSRIDHPPVFTCAQAEEIRPDLPGVSTKNLLMRGKSGNFYLVMTACEKRMDVKALTRTLGEADRLQFASPAELLETLGLTPGSVTVLALLNDAAGRVQLVVDAEIWQGESFLCHPLVNTATLVLPRADLIRFLELCQHPPKVVEIIAG